MAAKKKATWGEKHVEASLRYLGRGIGEDGHITDVPIKITRADVATEDGFRRAVARLVDMDGEERAVRQVRDIAEGRKRWETVVQGRLKHGTTVLYESSTRDGVLGLVKARGRHSRKELRLVRVTRLVRAR